MYAALSIFLSLIFLSVAVSHFFISDKKWAKINKTGCIAAGAAGILSAVFLIVFFRIRSSSFEEGKREWARDVISGYLKDVLPVLSIILAILILSAIFQPKMRAMRIIVTFAASVFLLVFGYISSFLSENDTVSVTFFIHALSISLAVLTQFCGYFDFRRLQEKLGAEEKNKKRKT